MKVTLLTLLLLILYAPARSQISGEVISISLPYSREKKVYQDVYIKNDNRKILSLTVACFEITAEHDSTRVYSVKTKKPKSKKKELFYSAIHLGTNENGSSFSSLYKDIVLKNNSLPAGNYRSYITIQYEDSIVTENFIQHVDSSLSIQSEAHKTFDNIYNTGKGKSFSKSFLNKQKNTPGASNVSSVLKKFSRKIDREFNSKGFTVSYRRIADKTFADVNCQGKYVGYYEIDMNEPLADKIEQKKALFTNNIAAGVSNKLEVSKPVFSQMKDLYSEKKDNDVVGNILITQNMANGQEEYSQTENNYYEIAGQVEVPVMNIPVTLEGYYTSQDQNRIAKASFFRMHYDSEKAKAALLKLIGGYKEKYNEAISQGKGMEKVYGTYLNSIAGEKDKLWADIAAQTGMINVEKFKVDTSGLLNEITKNYEKKLADSLTQLGDGMSGGKDMIQKSIAAKQAAIARYNKAMERYKQIQELEKKTKYYTTLLEQYRNNNYFDSLIAYDKLKDITSGSGDEKTYKQLAKSAEGLLPEGTTNKFMTGLNNLDAGIFSKQISAYTLNGQNIKGLDMGYDLGICEAGLTYGRVEYVSRDGQLDKYTGYSGRVSFRPGDKQKVTLIYYGYTPSNKMLAENEFFKEVQSYMPAFKTPIHIVSAMYSGEVTKYVKMEGEVASSFRTTDEFQRKDVNAADKMSYRLDIEGNIPETNIDLKGGYEHVGKQFENNTLPLVLSGTEKYSAGAKGQFLKDLLTLGVEYNYLVQQNFASQSSNSKWGFDVKISSKRYPSVSLSYKPFTTFQSFADTFNMPQRPILGEVWLGKLSYQIKKKTYILRLTAIYNKNTALVDTMESNSNVAQLNALYTKGKTSYMLNAGQTQVKADNLSSVHGKTNFLTIAASYNINNQWRINGGQDIGTMKAGLSRYAVNMGCGYRFKNIPLSLQASFRYNTYRMSEGQAWKTIYSGMLDMNWAFRFKMKDKI